MPSKKHLFAIDHKFNCKREYLVVEETLSTEDVKRELVLWELSK